MRRFFESNLFPTGKADFKSNWVSRMQTKPAAQTQQTKSQPQKQSLTQQEERDLKKANQQIQEHQHNLSLYSTSPPKQNKNDLFYIHNNTKIVYPPNAISAMNYGYFK